MCVCVCVVCARACVVCEMHVYVCVCVCVCEVYTERVGTHTTQNSCFPLTAQTNRVDVVSLLKVLTCHDSS